jgi:hypothetical protein
MADFNVIVKSLDNTKFLSGVTITAEWKNWLGGSEKQELITDAQGKAYFNIGISQTTVSVQASQGGNIDKGVVFVDLLGVAKPNPLILNLAFKPLESIQDTFKDLGKGIADNVKTIVIIGAIVGSITAVLFLLNLAKNAKPSLSSVTPNLMKKPEEKSV